MRSLYALERVAPGVKRSEAQERAFGVVKDVSLIRTLIAESGLKISDEAGPFFAEILHGSRLQWNAEAGKLSTQIDKIIKSVTGFFVEEFLCPEKLEGQTLVDVCNLASRIIQSTTYLSEPFKQLLENEALRTGHEAEIIGLLSALDRKSAVSAVQNQQARIQNAERAAIAANLGTVEQISERSDWNRTGG
jgi:hypothetical protein